MAAISAALLLVAQSAAATQASYQISALKQEQARLQADSDQLQALLAQAQAANRVDAVAHGLGMGHPTRWQYLPEAGSPIALAPRRSDGGSGGFWNGVLVVVGNLLEAKSR